MKLIKKIIYSGTIELKTGLHIGGTNTALNIGGPDKFVVRNPLNNVPYIPGSSLKGKMRSLIELKHGCCSESGGASEDPESISGALFGTAGKKERQKRQSRLIVRDAELDTTNPALFDNTDLPYTETKTEVAIDRISAQANPRTFERVPAGAKFNYSLVLNIYDIDDEEKLKRTLQEAMSLLEDDYLGGNGSRGYGQIKFHPAETIEKTEY